MGGLQARLRVLSRGGSTPRSPCVLSAEFALGRVWSRAVAATGHVVRWPTTGAVVGVAAVVAMASSEHAYAFVRAPGEAG
jgi:hypothetical protein